MPSPPPHTCWADADAWRSGFVILGANTNAIPTPPPQSQVIIGTDGFWGAHEWTVYPQPHRREFPYLAWIPLRQSNTTVPSNVLTYSVDKSMWQVHPDKSNIRVVNPTLLDKLTKEWMSIKAAVQDPFKTISSDPSFSPVRHPMEAYVRAVAALSRLEDDFGAWRDFVEVFRNLQRYLLELRAFLDWWKDIRAGDDFRSPIRAPTRGAIFEDAQLYETYVNVVLDLAKEVKLLPRKSCTTQPMSLQPLTHSLPHWYYPPLVRDVITELETAARGYAERLDTFNSTKGFKRKQDKTKNRTNDQAGRRAKKAKTIMTSLATHPNNQELRRLTDAGAAPDWSPGTQEVWTHALGHVSYLNLASQVSPRRFVFPPVHLFWGGEPQNQRIYNHHYLVLFDEIKNRPERDLPALTTQEWRSILGNTYWKKQWPKHNGNNPSTFDPNVFWKYGGSLFFGDERSADVAAGRYNPTSRLSCHCDVQLATADDTDIRQVVVYHLNSFHVYEEIREMERLQFPIVEMWDPSKGGVNPDFFCDKNSWRRWVRAVRDVVVDWDGFDRWDWGCLSNVRELGIDKLSGRDFHKFTVTIRRPYVVLPPILVILVLITEKGLATDSSIFLFLTSRMSGPHVRPPATAPQTLSQRSASPRHILSAVGLSLTTGKYKWPDVDLLVEDRLPSRVEDSDVGVKIYHHCVTEVRKLKGTTIYSVAQVKAR
ncbi:hypothetical protein EDB84DRAFT_1562111 [Lactarius hengduanensis]|nr:hypothetical protein EDB84DRAFT_1562111 [Lactarius hengduanensis]